MAATSSLRRCAALSLLLTACALPSPEQPEQATTRIQPWQAPEPPAPVFERHAVAAAHPLAAEAARGVLREGGSAVDAAIAAQLVLGLVEPQSSGLGGGAFLLVWDGRSIDAWDGRETAPAAVTEHWFLDATGRPLPFSQAVVGGRSVGVPGVIRMLAAAHRQHGRLPWERLFEPAIALARQGYPVGPRLAQQLAGDESLRRDPHARAFYYDSQGRAWPAGTRLRNTDQAWVLQALASQGADAFYRGPIAEAIVRAVHGHPVQAGVLSLEDLSGYAPVHRSALCAPWRTWRLCGMPPPSSGLIAVGQMLQLIDAVRPADPADVTGDGVPTAAYLHRWAEAGRLAFADREAYVADPDFVALPGRRWQALVDPAYLQARARTIGPTAGPDAQPGQPWTPASPISSAADTSAEIPATSHLSIVDGRGQAVAMTTSIEAQFGARVMVNTGHGSGGFLLNNQLTDFSFMPQRDGRPVANRIEPGKRPRSSMSPLFVFDRDSGRLEATLGAPGGPFIIHYVAKTLLGLYALGLSPQRAVDAPNAGVIHTEATAPLWVESGALAVDDRRALSRQGHVVREAELPSGVQLLVRRPDGRWTGAADRRREGVVLGD